MTETRQSNQDSKPAEGQTPNDAIQGEGSQERVDHQTTFYGAVHGPVHTGSGDIEIGRIDYTQSPQQFQELYAALDQLKAGVESARSAGLDQQIADSITEEVAAIEEEVQQRNPDKENLLRHLKRAKEYLTTGAAIATATAAGMTAMDTLIPQVERLLELVQQLF